MKKILILTTGGTIASVQSPDGLVPGMSSEQLRGHLPQIGADIAIDIIELFHIDSTDMTVDHWITIIHAIRDHYDDYDGFVICHGTDTMAYTAAMLSYTIQDSDKPIVLTGAQKPIGFEITDAKSNLQDSILYAADPRSRGVQVVFAGKVIAGTRARKIRSMSFSAFSSINLPEIADINNGQIIRYLTDPAYCKPAGEGNHSTGAAVRFCDAIDPNVFLLKLTPSMSPELLPEIFRIYDAIVIESFGAGGIPASLEQTLFEELAKYRPEEKILAMTTQVPFEGSHLETYAVGRRIAGSFQILEARDITLEATVAKLMWILADKDQSWEEIQRRFYTPIAMDTLITPEESCGGFVLR
ncbi:MAG: asparaginase [Firmicutes bacterium]|nr:asparaginase [Bacillota bacterium]